MGPAIAKGCVDAGLARGGSVMMTFGECMMKATVRRFGNALGIVLPASVATRLRVTEGAEFDLTDTADGLRLTPRDAGFAKQMKAARRGLRRYRKALRELAR